MDDSFEKSVNTLPSYMGFLLEFDDTEDTDLPQLDIDAVNRMVALNCQPNRVLIIEED